MIVGSTERILFLRNPASTAYPNEKYSVSIRKISDIRNGKSRILNELMVSKEVKDGKFRNWFFATYRFERKKFNIIGRKKTFTKINPNIIFSRFVIFSVTTDGAVKYL